MHWLGLTFLGRLSPLARPLLRAVIGGVVVLHGWSLLRGTTGEALTAWVRAEGVPAPSTFSDVAAVALLAAGTGLVVGLFTRLGALVVALSASAALVLGAPLVPRGPGELDVALMAGAVAVALLGPGSASVDHVLGIDRSDDERRRFKRPEGSAFSSPAAARRVTRRSS